MSRRGSVITSLRVTPGAMRVMVMHKVDATMEAGGPVDQRIVQQMGQLIGRSLKAGIFKDGAGLHRSATRARWRSQPCW